MATNRLIQIGKTEVYAEAAFNAANESGGQEAVLEVRNQMLQIRRLINSDMDLSIALNDQTYTPDQRHQLASAVFADCNPALREVLAVMAENLDIDLLGNVYHAYEKVVGDKLNLCVVDVVTVVPLNDSIRRLIEEKAEADLGYKAVLNESIDKSILGGIIMSVNGMRIDASIVSQINHARQVLKRRDGGES